MRKFLFIITAMVVLFSFVTPKTSSDDVKQSTVSTQTVPVPQASLVPDYTWPIGEFLWYKLGNTCQCWFMVSWMNAIEVGQWVCRASENQPIVHGIPCSNDEINDIKDVIAETKRIISMDY